MGFFEWFLDLFDHEAVDDALEDYNDYDPFGDSDNDDLDD